MNAPFYIGFDSSGKMININKPLKVWCFIGDAKRPCDICGEETSLVSIKFKCPMCSEKCNDVKHEQYNKFVKSYIKEL